MYKLHLYSSCVLLLILVLNPFAKGATYYSKGSLPIQLPASWSSTPDGSGPSPSNMNGSHTWIIQAGDSMYLTGNTALSLSTSTVTVLSGGVFMNESSSSSIFIGTFQMFGGAVYYHRTTATSVPGTTKQLANSTNGGNGNSHVIIKTHWHTTPLTGTYGDLTIEHTNTSIWNMSGNLTDIEGDFTFNTNSTSAFRLNSGSVTLNVGGNFRLLSGVFQMSSNQAATYILNIGGSFIQSGGTFTPTPSTHAMQVNFTGSNSGFEKTGGTLNTHYINWKVQPAAGLSLVSDLPVASSRTVSVGGALSIGANTKLDVSGNLEVTGTISGPGKVLMNGLASQTISGTGSIANLEINSAGGVSITPGDSITVTGLLECTSGTFTTNDGLILGSADGTSASMVAPGGGTIAGNVTVERFIPARRAWRLVTAPVIPTVNSVYGNWQNNGQTIPGSGVEVWGPGGDFATTGLQPISSGAFSMRTYDAATNSWSNVTNTINQPMSIGGQNLPFLLFVTGHTGSGNISSGASATTLRATGQLLTGTQSYALNGGANSLALIGNPYVYPVDFNKAWQNLGPSSNVARKFWSWDPNLNTVGGYVTIQYNGSDYTITPEIPGGQDQIIQNGQAFFIQATDASAQFEIREDDKDATGSQTAVFRSNGGDLEVLRINLSSVSPASTPQLIDAAVLNCHQDFSNGINHEEDAFKFFNINESISVKSNGGKYAIEGRKLLDDGDTVRIGLNGMRQADFELEIVPTDFNAPGLTATLYDTYLNTSIPVSLTNSTVYPFSVTTAASGNDSRFFLAFTNTTPLSDASISLTATENGGDVVIRFSVNQDAPFTRYIVEKSADGRSFEELNMIEAKEKVSEYEVIDSEPVQGSNYYRVKAINRRGGSLYSNIARIVIGTPVQFTVHPNPVSGQFLHLDVSGRGADTYAVVIINSMGQTVHFVSFLSEGSQTDRTIDISKLPAGVYAINLINAAGATIANTKFTKQ